MEGAIEIEKLQQAHPDTWEAIVWYVKTYGKCVCGNPATIVETKEGE